MEVDNKVVASNDVSSVTNVFVPVDPNCSVSEAVNAPTISEVAASFNCFLPESRYL